MKITTLTEYTPEIAARVRELLIQLSRSGKDRGEIPQEWFDELIASDAHDMLLAIDDSGKIQGIATLSIIIGPIVRRVAYLEDFVTDAEVRGQGVGHQLWEAMLQWAKAKNCTELCFTSGHGREAAQEFYQKRGAEIYDTNFFRKNIV
jgi:GNAT superfamily N-acetyltransferase